MSTDIETTLEDRGSKYGSFDVHAQITQDLKYVMQDSPNWRNRQLTPSMREALEMVAHKIGRILNGDPTYLDSWVDIEGYVHLVTKELSQPSSQVQSKVDNPSSNPINIVQSINP